MVVSLVIADDCFDIPTGVRVGLDGYICTLLSPRCSSLCPECFSLVHDTVWTSHS